MSFQQRLKKSQELEEFVFTEFQAMGFSVAKNGTEHTHPIFVEQLRKSTDATSLSIRFAPDGVACIGKIPRSFYIEIKASESIERMAYAQYEKLVKNQNVLICVFQHDKLGTLPCWAFFDRIVLVHGFDAFHDYREKFPVDADGWILPRQTKAHIGCFSGSGTDFRYINKHSLTAWNTQYVKQQLIAYLHAITV